MYRKIIEFQPCIASENIGDYIIQDYVDKAIENMFGPCKVVSMPTKTILSRANYRWIRSGDYSFVCGTNLICSHMRKNHQWNVSVIDAFMLSDIILMGVGWWQYQDEPDAYTKWFLGRILSQKYIHSVRDSFTETMLKKAGIKNVINTGCPTMWGLTPEKIAHIPRNKAKSVVTTLTNYKRNDVFDKEMLEILLRSYEKVYVWLQAIEDYQQLRELGFDGMVEVIPPTLKAYDEILTRDIDYIGTRLHGGIRALNAGKRSLIVAVDNRAIEISKDTGLPIIDRNNVKEMLEDKINEVSEFNITLPNENIETWKRQFMGERLFS